MWSQRVRSRRFNRSSRADESGVAVLEYVGMIALAALLVVAVAGAMTTSALPSAASNAVHCVTTFNCSHAGSAPADSPPAQPAAGREPPAGSADPGESAAAQQPAAQTPAAQGVTTRRALPGGFGAAGMSGVPLLLPPWRSGPIGPPWRTGPIEPPGLTPPWRWIPYNHRHIVSCEPNVGCH